MSDNALQATRDHEGYLVELADPAITEERVEEITRDAVATYDLMNYSDAVCDLGSEKMQALDSANRRVHLALRQRRKH